MVRQTRARFGARAACSKGQIRRGERSRERCGTRHAGRMHRVRLAVRGGGHSYQGTSNAPDSLLVWTRYADDIVLHDAFVRRACEGLQRRYPPCRWARVRSGRRLRCSDDEGRPLCARRWMRDRRRRGPRAKRRLRQLLEELRGPRRRDCSKRSRHRGWRSSYSARARISPRAITSNATGNESSSAELRAATRN